MSLAVCRVCLANNIRMKTIANTELQTLFEKLTNIKLIADDGMPQSVCYVCLLLLQRCCKFVEISQKSEKFLTQLLHDGIELTQETLSRTNDAIQNTLHGLSVSNTTFVSILDNFKEENFKVTVKAEPEKYYAVIENENEHEAEISDGNESMGEDKSELACPKSGEDSKTSFLKQSQEIKCDKPVRNYQQNKTKKELKGETKTTDYKNPEKDKKIPTLVMIDADYKHVLTNKKETHKYKDNVKNNKITYKCNKCPKAFRQKWYLKNISVFTLEKNHMSVTYICAAGFISPVLLKQHKATHTDTPYSCHICSKQFGQKPHLTEHIRTHTGEKLHS